MCDCIEQLEKQIKEIDPSASGIHEKQMFLNPNAKFGDTHINNYKLVAHFTTKKKKKDGTYSDKKILNILKFTYCPFCGKRY